MYLLDGTKVQVISETTDGLYVVREICEAIYANGESFDIEVGGVRIVENVFEAAPVAKVSAEVSQLHATKRELRDEIAAIRAEIRTATHQRDETLKTLTDYPALKHLEEILAKTFTHYAVIPEYGARAEIIEFEDTRDARSHQREHRLLTLYGGSHGDLRWGLSNSVSGPSGDGGRCYPCTSYEEAVDKIRDWLSEKFAGGAEQKHIDTANHFGIDVPDGYAEKVRAAMISSAKTRVVSAAEILSRRECELDALQR